MKLNELADYLLINTNQYYIGKDNIEVNIDVLRGLTKQALTVYGNVKPKRYRNFDFWVEKEVNPIFEVDGREVVNILNMFIIDPVYAYTPVQFNWEYNVRNHILYTQVTGNFIIDFLVKPTLDDITYDDIEFLVLMKGLYLMYIAEVRKGFKLDDLPFSNDADELYSEGKELFENTREQLETETGSWYLAIESLIG